VTRIFTHQRLRLNTALLPGRRPSSVFTKWNLQVDLITNASVAGGCTPIRA